MGHFNVAVFTESKDRKEVEKLLEPYGEGYFDVYFREGHYCDVLEYRENPHARYDWYSPIEFVDIANFENVYFAVLPTGIWYELWENDDVRELIIEKAKSKGWFMAIVDCHC